MINRSLIIAVLSVFALLGCGGQRISYDIPEPLVDETLYLSDPSSFNLTVLGGQVVIPQAGHGGILVYRRYFDQEFYDFAAYELACPEHWMESCGELTSINGDLYLTCGCDQHQYQLLDGQSIDTNYFLPVKEFRCSFDGVNIIRITN